MKLGQRGRECRGDPEWIIPVLSPVGTCPPPTVTPEAGREDLSMEDGTIYPPAPIVLCKGYLPNPSSFRVHRCRAAPLGNPPSAMDKKTGNRRCSCHCVELVAALTSKRLE